MTIIQELAQAAIMAVPTARKYQHAIEADIFEQGCEYIKSVFMTGKRVTALVITTKKPLKRWTATGEIVTFSASNGKDYYIYEIA